ncbi:MAG: saccharopine dehydrogenase NADP-binding domain-containing protein [Novosphingobium sp.]|nr:saccharopine dehydrogenase NADP-binding domain-containing protein [Novosphingobium sp.]
MSVSGTISPCDVAHPRPFRQSLGHLRYIIDAKLRKYKVSLGARLRFSSRLHGKSRDASAFSQDPARPDGCIGGLCCALQGRCCLHLQAKTAHERVVPCAAPRVEAKMANKTFDIIVYGATSFVGQIITRYMHEQFADGAVRWAIAGRSADKLKTLSDAIGLSGVEVIVADAADETALKQMCAQTRVVMSTVGPYALYGDLLVQVCAESGTDYCDLTGEPQWIRRMQIRHEAEATRTGARIVHCCGFDSIPSDLGVHFLQRLALQAFGAPCSRIDMRVVSMKGGASGGTIASMINMVKEAVRDPGLRQELNDPYSLCPPGHAFSRPQRDVKVEHDDAYGGWIAPFIMAGINTRVVHRSNALSNNSYGTQFLYEEAMVTGPGAQGKRKARATAWGVNALMIGLAIPPVRWVLETMVLPKPGEGPSEQAQLEGGFDILFHGSTATGQTIRCRVTGDRDPGYGSTAKMLSQAAACLAGDVADDVPGGFWTPATVLGDKLIERLEAHAGLVFERLP